MTNKRLLVLVVLGVLLTFAFGGRTAQAQDLGPNLLKNPGFEDGWAYQDNITQLAAPNNWRYLWSDRELIFGNTEWVTTRPETAVWNRGDAPPNEVDLFWKDGIYNVKLWNSWAPLWASMTQDVSGLQTGGKYRFIVPIYPDIIQDYKDGKKVAPEKLETGKVRLCAGPKGAPWRDETKITCSGWWTGASVSPFYQAWSTFVWDFTATQPDMTVYIDMAVDYAGYPNNGFFIDTVGLYAMGPAPAAPAPTVAAAAAAAQPAQPAQPLPTATPRTDGAVIHVVESGDTMWVIAVKYAQQLGKTPEEALPYLMELNNEPAFLNIGDEVVIIPGNQAAQPTVAATVEVTATVEITATTEPAAPIEPTAPAEPTATVAPTTAPEPTTAAPGTLAGSVCVAAFEDANADGVRDASEALVPNAAIAISRGSNTVSTYITDGLSEPYCFDLNEADTYQLQLYPPDGYTSTTESSWAVAVANGEAYTVSFGMRQGEAVAAADAPAAEEPAAAAETPAETDSGLFGNLGLVVLGVAGVLALLAIVGVVLLRRS